MKNPKVVNKLSLDSLKSRFSNYALSQSQLGTLKGGNDSDQVDYVGIVDIVDG